MDEQFSEHITWFQKHIDSRRRMLPLFVGMAGKMASRVRKDLFEFVDEHCKDIERYENGDPHKFKVPVELNNRYRQLRGFHSDSSVFFNLLPRMTFISLVSIYDAYLSRLLKLIFKIRPEILNSSERQFSFKDINDFDSFDDMKEATIEAEVESFLRKGHVEQIKWLENKLSSSTKKLNLRSGLKNWGVFVELTERRNLLVHNDGIVSKNYIKVCNDNNISCNKAIGEQLDIDSEYYKEACNCINEIGAKLGHVLWRKLKPTNESCQKADDNLIELIFNLLISKDYDLAIKLCELVEFKSFRVTTQQSLFYIKINHAIALKGLEKQNDCAYFGDSEQRFRSYPITC